MCAYTELYQPGMPQRTALSLLVNYPGHKAIEGFLCPSLGGGV